jgi:pimeloyl-ACP methyl ester carboxylesterase
MFLECRGARVGFDIESLQFVPSGQTLLQRRTVLVLHSGRSAAARASDRQMFSGLHERFQVVQAWLDPADTTALTQSVEEFCSSLELNGVLLVGVGAAAPIAALLAMRAPALVSKLALLGASPSVDEAMAELSQSFGRESRLLVVDTGKPGASGQPTTQLDSFFSAP